jgi:hypothetical protein
VRNSFRKEEEIKRQILLLSRRWVSHPLPLRSLFFPACAFSNALSKDFVHVNVTHNYESNLMDKMRRIR